MTEVITIGVDLAKNVLVSISRRTFIRSMALTRRVVWFSAAS